MEAAARLPAAAFVISSSGPGVTPEQQERYATRLYMLRAGIDESGIDEARRYYDDVVALMREGASLAEAKRRIEDRGYPPAFVTLELPVLPEDEGQWKLAAALMDYDPRPALERIRVPFLAVYGGDDPITPPRRASSSSARPSSPSSCTWRSSPAPDTASKPAIHQNSSTGISRS